MPLTNRGKILLLDGFFRGGTMPTNVYIALCTADTTPTPDTATLGDLTEIAAGNGYTSGGLQLDRNATDWDTLTQDDTNDRGTVQAVDVTFTPSGGDIPASGNGFRYVVLTDDDATVGSREVLAWWDLGSAYTASNPFAFVDLEQRLASGAALTYLFLDRFETDDNPPLASPLAANVGEWTVIDPNNAGSIASGLLSIQAVPSGAASFTPRLTSDSAHVRTPGLTSVITFQMPDTATNARFALDDSTSGDIHSTAYAVQASAQNVFDRGFDVAWEEYVTTLEAFTPGSFYRIAIVLRSGGALFLAKGEPEYPTWTLLFVTNNCTTSPVHEVVVERPNCAWAVDTVETVQLSGGYADDWGLADDREATTISGTTLAAAAADALLEWTFTAVASTVHSLEFRRSDASNLWRIDCNVATQVIQLVKRESAVDTVFAGPTTVTLTAGTSYRVVVRAVGPNIWVWLTSVHGGPQVQTGAATFNQSATGVQVNGAGANLAAWPRLLNASQAAALNLISSASIPSSGGGNGPDLTGLWTPAEWATAVNTDEYTTHPGTSIYAYDHATYFDPWCQLTHSYYQYFVSYGLDGNLSFYEAGQGIAYLNRAIYYVLNVIDTAVLSSTISTSQYKDSYYGWPSDSHDNYLETRLRESLFWRHAARMLRLMRANGLDTSSGIYSGSTTYKNVFDTVLAFLETNIFDKWWNRGIGNFFPNRTFDTAHMAHLGLEVALLTANATRAANGRTAWNKYCTDMTPYRVSSMRGQLFAHPADSRAYAWNGYWGNFDLPGVAQYDDWSHLQSDVSVIIEAEQLGEYWTQTDCEKFAALLRYVLWDGSYTTPRFYGYLAQTAMGDGFFQGNGSRLGRYDVEVQKIMQGYVDDQQYKYYLTQVYGNACASAYYLGVT